MPFSTQDSYNSDNNWDDNNYNTATHSYGNNEDIYHDYGNEDGWDTLLYPDRADQSTKSPQAGPTFMPFPPGPGDDDDTLVGYNDKVHCFIFRLHFIVILFIRFNRK